MISGSSDAPERAAASAPPTALDAAPPVLVLGLGNTLLGDDGVGPLLVEELARQLAASMPEVEFLDGGTQGLALLGRIAGRRALVVLDALARGKAPGKVSVLNTEAALALAAPHASTAHEGNAAELLATAALLGDLPRRVFVVGIEPLELQTRVGLSAPVSNAIPAALARARMIIESLCAVPSLVGA